MRFRMSHFIIFIFIIFITEIKIKPELYFTVYLPSGPLNWDGKERKCVSAGVAVCQLVPMGLYSL